MLKNPFRRGSSEIPARALYGAIVEAARRPEFYRRCGVPDTLDGRFDLVALHAFLLFHRLKRDRPASADLAQKVFDILILDMDQSLRELGAGDLGVGRRVKRMAQGLYGRIAAYESGIEGPNGVLEAALRRNLFGTVDPDPVCVAAVMAYVREQATVLAGHGLTALAAGELRFGAPPDLTIAP